MCGDGVDILGRGLIPAAPASEVDILMRLSMRGTDSEKPQQELVPPSESANMASAEKAAAPTAEPLTKQASASASASAVSTALHQKTVIVTGTILTMAGGRYNATEAFAVRGDTIVATGNLDEVRAAVGARANGQEPGIQTIDYGTGVVTPGFVDPHVHLLLTALVADENRFVDLSYPGVRTQRDALEKIKTAVQYGAVNRGNSGIIRWIAGYGFDPSLVAEHPNLTRALLDEVSDGQTAVFIMNQSGHVGYINSAGFAALGIGIRRGDPGYPADNENYQKNTDDPTGVLTGLVFEDAVNDVSRNLPKPAEADAVAGARSVLQTWATKGITTVFDCGIGVIGEQADLALLRRALDRTTAGGAIFPRFHGALTLQTVRHLAPVADLLRRPPLYLTTDNGASAASVYAIKFWLDGSTQGFTAAVYKPYRSQPDNYGILNFRQGTNLDAPPDDDRLVSLVQPFVRNGWQIIMHTNGSRAFDQALRVYARVLAAEAIDDDIYGNGTGDMHRRHRHMHRLEHVTADITPTQLARAAQLNLGVSHLIAHVRRWGDAFAQWVLDGERAARLDPVADVVRSGLTYSFHSDSPISEANPLQYVETASSRVLEATGAILGPEQRVTVEEALAGITYNPAKQLGRLDEIGSLEPGKKADFVVLDTDLRVSNPSKIVSSVRILETWIGGRMAYKA
ncbi:Amidohydrolase 3 [Niveomyces insectorum RCEF 264]|uniref:Amidohydrolase 3 n=1 Tax=Niveomyces insectorum RCEF 264 TaxID=1081102 RepID=A0A162IEV2_9HYPO|nr:Amidohydrolase 3 [Niveomyces insectorum RCEF 264]